MSNLNQLKIAISAGEISGDQHAACLVAQLKNLNPNLSIKGMGGKNLLNQEVELVVDSEKSAAVMGFSELIGGFRKVYRALSTMKLLLKQWRPDILILVDFPDFNLRLAKYAKKLGIKVFYFISPKLWAWRAGRVKQIKANVDHLALIFPFEEEFYKQHKFDRKTFVGHPYAESIKRSTKDRLEFCKEFNLNPDKPILAVLPGSRQSELKAHLPVLENSLKIIFDKQPDIQVVYALARPVDNYKFPSNITVCYGRSLDLMRAADLGLIKSGTSNLEAGLCDLPFAMFYKASKFSETIFKFFSPNFKDFSMLNILKSGTVREYYQENFTAENLAIEVEKLLDPKEQARQKDAFLQIRAQLHLPQAYQTTAKLVMHEISKQKLSNLELLKRVISFLAIYKWQFFLSIICMIIFGATDGGIPFIVKHILDGVFAEKNQQMLNLLPIVVVLFAVIRSASDFGQQFLSSKIGLNIIRDIRNKINQKLLTLGSDFYVEQSSGNLLSRFTSDVVMLRALLVDSVAALLRDSVRIIALIVTALYLDATLALIAFVVFPLAFYPIYRFGRKIRKLSKRGQDATGVLSGMLHEVINGQKVVKTFGREQFEAERFAKQNDELTKTFIKSERTKALTGPVNEILASFAIVGVLLYGGHSVINGVRSQGDFIAFLLSVMLLYDPFKKLSKMHATFQQGFAAAERIFELLDVAPSIKNPEVTIELNADNSIEFKELSFGYKPDKYVLHDLNLKVPQGQKLALVGLSGSGKTTLVDLIARFMDPQKGQILVGGVDIKNVDLHKLRSRISLVGQHTFLFNDTIWANIAYGKATATDKEVIEAAKAAYAYDFIMQLPQGFQSQVGEQGLTLSGGQRQRIAIARALLKDAPILLLDEATASLDNQSEHEVQMALEALQANRTTIVIAHRLSTVRSVDKIVVLKAGKIIEVGTHNQLINQQGEYTKLYKLQFNQIGQAADESYS